MALLDETQKKAAIDNITKQILAQGLTDKWSGQGYGSAEANARDMARLIADTGVTDIRQFGKVPLYEKAEIGGYTYNGTKVAQNRAGDYYYTEPTGRSSFEPETGQTTYYTRDVFVPKDAKLDPIYGRTVQGSWNGEEGRYESSFVPATASDVVMKDGVRMVKTGEDYGNKETGQPIAMLGRRQGGEGLFGGTGEGKGNTGYRVQFTADGMPIFYTTGASSNDLANLFATDPILGAIAQAGAAYFGGPVGTAALAAAMGKSPEEVAKAALLAYVGQEVTSSTGGTDGLLGGPSESALDAGMNVYGGTGNIGMDGLNAGLNAYPSTGNIGTDGLVSPVEITGTPPPTSDLISPVEITGTPPPTSDLISPVEVTGTPPPTPDLISPVEITGTPEPTPDLVSPVEITGTPESPIPASTAAAIAAKSPISVSDAIRLAGLAATVAGGSQVLGSVGSSGSGGFDIVPIPSDWTSPITSGTGVASLPPIDFGNKEMLRGTQWERLLSPNYGKISPPIQYAQPSKMSFDELTRILGGSRSSIPTQNLTINDVIAGIQNQYGQAP